MKKTALLLFLCIPFLISLPAQNTDRNELLLSQQEAYQAYRKHRDTITVRTWTNVVTLNGLLEQLVRADSLLIAANPGSLSASSDTVMEKQLLDTIARLKGRIEYMKLAPPRNTQFLTPKDYLLLFGISFALFVAGIVALIMLRKVRRANLAARESQDELETVLDSQAQYETRLEEINATLTEITRDREVSLQQISELNRALIHEKQQNQYYRELSESLEKEKEKWKHNQEIRVSENPALPSSAGLITENNLLKSEIMQTRQRIAELEEETAALRNQQSAAPTHEQGQDVMKYKLELQKSAQTQLQLKDRVHDLEEKIKFLSAEKDRMTSERDISMETVKTLRDRLERIENELQVLKNDKDKLNDELGGKSALRDQMDLLNAEILRWKSENETLRAQIAQEIKLRRDIEADIQKVIGRLGNSSQG